MAVPRDSWVILSFFRVSVIGGRVSARRQDDSWMETYEPHLPMPGKLQE